MTTSRVIRTRRSAAVVLFAARVRCSSRAARRCHRRSTSVTRPAGRRAGAGGTGGGRRVAAAPERHRRHRRRRSTGGGTRWRLVPAAARTGGGGSTGGGGTGGGGGGRGSGGGSTGGGGGRRGGGSTGGGGGTAVSGTTVGSCAGFKNSDHITSSTIPIANISDTSGPVSGLFTGAQQGIKAYVAYFNATSSICGRKLSLENLDSQTSSTGDQQAATTACGNAFAIVGSMGAFDDGGASTVTNCGIPDLRAAVTESARLQSPVVYATQSLNVRYQPTTFADYYKKAFPASPTRPPSSTSAPARALRRAGDDQDAEVARLQPRLHLAGPVTEINYTGYVAKMQSAGVKYVEYVGSAQQAVSIAKAMEQQNFHPVYVLDPEAYNPTFVQSGGSAAERRAHLHQRAAVRGGVAQPGDAALPAMAATAPRPARRRTTSACSPGPPASCSRSRRSSSAAS